MTLPSLFEESLQSDMAIVIVELEQLSAPTPKGIPKVPHTRAGRQPLSDTCHLVEMSMKKSSIGI